MQQLIEVTVELSSIDWHIISTGEIFQRLSTSPTQGLSAEKVKRKLEEFWQEHTFPTSHPSLQTAFRILLQRVWIYSSRRRDPGVRRVEASGPASISC